MSTRGLSPEARHAVIVEALSDAIVARVRRRLAEQARGAAGAPSPADAANDTSPARAVASRR